MDTRYFDNCRLYLTTDKRIVELAQEGIRAREAWIKCAEAALGYTEEDLAIFTRYGDLWCAGLRTTPREEGWRKQDNIWVPRMSTKTGKAIFRKIKEVGRYYNTLRAWLEAGEMLFRYMVPVEPMRVFTVKVDIMANEDNTSFVWCVPTIAPEEIHQKVEGEYGGVEITFGAYIDKYKDHEYRMW